MQLLKMDRKRLRPRRLIGNRIFCMYQIADARENNLSRRIRRNYFGGNSITVPRVHLSLFVFITAFVTMETSVVVPQQEHIGLSQPSAAHARDYFFLDSFPRLPSSPRHASPMTESDPEVRAQSYLPTPPTCVYQLLCRILTVILVRKHANQNFQHRAERVLYVVQCFLCVPAATQLVFHT
jgi:hypothetical protein